jgi:hypothetical protein
MARIIVTTDPIDRGRAPALADDAPVLMDELLGSMVVAQVHGVDALIHEHGSVICERRRAAAVDRVGRHDYSCHQLSFEDSRWKSRPHTASPP